MAATAQSTASAAEAAPPRGRWLREVWASTIGKKVIVAITGVILAIYVLLHALGNLKVLQGAGDGGPAAIDTYAEWLRTVGGPPIPREGLLWTVRVVLVAALLLHLVAVVQLYLRNRAARGWANPRAHERTLASRTMLLSGILILAFVVFHILNFTTGTIDPTPIVEGEVYANLYHAFQEWYLVIPYVAVGLLVGLHLHHSLWSVTQTMGWDKPNRNRTFRRAAAATALLVGLGFAFVPILFWTDVLPAPEATVSASGEAAR